MADDRLGKRKHAVSFATDRFGLPPSRAREFIAAIESAWKSKDQIRSADHRSNISSEKVDRYSKAQSK